MSTYEDKFEVAVKGDRSISQMSYHTAVSTVNVYEFMDHAYFGSGGFRNGRYLVPFSRECAYEARRELAHYKNYMKPIVRAMVEPVFNETAERSVKDQSGNELKDTMFNAFMNNCDAAGTGIQSFTHVSTNMCRRHGVVFIVMDNYQTTAQPRTVAEAIATRTYPYVYTKSAQDVDSAKVDPFGNLKEIVFTDTPETVNKGGKAVLEPRWRKWTETESIIMGKDKKNSLYVISSATHNVGRVPVIIVYADVKEDKSVVLPDPPLYDIARLNHVIFNQSAEIRDQERAQAFSIFYVQGLAPGDLSIGNNTYINLPENVTIPPGYASPDFNIIKGLVENQEKIREDLFSIAEQNGVVGVQSSKSGIAMQWDFWAHESVLLHTSQIASEIENKISDLFKLYTNEDYVYTVSYPDDFAPQGVDAEVARIDKVLRMPSLNSKLANKIMEKLARLVLYDIDEEELADVINDINKDEVLTEEPAEEEVLTEEPQDPQDEPPAAIEA